MTDHSGDIAVGSFDPEETDEAKSIVTLINGKTGDRNP